MAVKKRKTTSKTNPLKRRRRRSRKKRAEPPMDHVLGFALQSGPVAAEPWESPYTNYPDDITMNPSRPLRKEERAFRAMAPFKVRRPR